MSQKAIPIIDFDALITAINALSAPSATDVAVSTANMHYITEDDAQGALAELDAEAYAINSSLAQSLGKGNHSIHCFPTGYITTGGTLLSLFIPLSIKAEVTSVSLVSLTGWSLRIPTGGYLTFATPDTTYIDLVSGGIRLTCIKNNGWGVTNNIIVGGDIDATDMTFKLS